MPHWWFPWVRVPDTSEEAAAELAKLEERDPEVQRLGEELRERQVTNNFSRMVASAIARAAGGARHG